MRKVFGSFACIALLVATYAVATGVPCQWTGIDAGSVTGGITCYALDSSIACTIYTYSGDCTNINTSPTAGTLGNCNYNAQDTNTLVDGLRCRRRMRPLTGHTRLLNKVK